MYEFRWSSRPAELDAIITELLSTPGVSGASRSAFGPMAAAASPPGDWNDDGSAAIWPFTQIRAQQGWDSATEGSVTVGIVDEETVLDGHEDLNVVTTLGSRRPGTHATHVAGLACPEAKGKGLVAVAWGFPIVTSRIPDASFKSVLAAARTTALAGAAGGQHEPRAQPPRACILRHTSGGRPGQCRGSDRWHSVSAAL